jgi:hypothetical protein
MLSGTQITAAERLGLPRTLQKKAAQKNKIKGKDHRSA